MLYTVVPLSRIYGGSDRQNKNIKSNELSSCVFGHVSLKQQGDHKIIDRLLTTDPAAYLHPDYQPGKIYFD